MPAYQYQPNKNKAKKLWYAKINYTNINGNKIRKTKRGFKTKKEALEFEQDYLRKHKGSIDMKFSDFFDIYIKENSHKWKPSTIQQKQSKFRLHLEPFFGNKPLNDITNEDIRNWQQDQLKKDLEPATIRKNNVILSSIFNYAVRYYNLYENPCSRVGLIGSNKNKPFEFWTLSEYKEFIKYEEDLKYKVAFDTLYYTGLRIGELTALTPADIDFTVPKIHVSKNYQVINGKEYIDKPKTEKSIRDIILPVKIAEEIKELIKNHYNLEENSRIFNLNKSSYGNRLRKICRQNNLKQIRIHDFRHSHVSLLIELGYSPMLIAERLGHDDIKTTLNVYGHLYPNKQLEMSQELNKLI